jgi:hypothetical protein
MPRTAALLLISLLPAGQLLKAQSSKPAGAENQQIAELKQSLAKNHAALTHYTWTETTEILVKGSVKKEEKKQCKYGPDGKVQKTDLGGEEPQQQPQSRGRRGGRLKKAIIEKKVDELKDYMQRAAALIHSYVPPDAQKLQAAAALGNLSVKPETDGLLMLDVTAYLKAGDGVHIGFNKPEKRLATYAVQSYLDDPKKDVVTLDVTFAALQDGTSHVQQTVFESKAKNVQVRVNNSDYQKLP